MATYGPKEQAPTNYAGMVGWSVGLSTWLDDPASKVNRYWRVVEFGSLASGWPWKGERVAGLWGPNAGPRKNLWGSATTEFDSSRVDQKFAPYFGKKGQDMLGPARKALWDFMGGGKGPNMEKLDSATYYMKYVTKKRKDGSVRRSVRRVEAHTPGQLNKARKALFFWFMKKSTDASQLPFVQGTISKDIPPGDYYRDALASFPMEAEQEQALRTALNFALREVGKKNTLTHLRGQQKGDNYSQTASKGTLRNPVTNSSLKSYSGHRRAFVSVAADLRVQALIFDAGHRFVNGTWQSALREANELVAIRFQEAVVAEMSRRSTRPPTGDLIKATKDPKNRYPHDKG